MRGQYLLRAVLVAVAALALGVVDDAGAPRPLEMVAASNGIALVCRRHPAHNDTEFGRNRLRRR